MLRGYAAISTCEISGSRHIFQKEQEESMAKPEEMYQCQTVDCGYVYDPDKGDRRRKVPSGTAFADLPEEWRCPSCGAGKKLFRPLAGAGSVVAEQS